MSGPACTFRCTNECWHSCFISMVKRSQIKGRCLYLLKKKEARTKKRAAQSKGEKG